MKRQSDNTHILFFHLHCNLNVIRFNLLEIIFTVSGGGQWSLGSPRIRECTRRKDYAEAYLIIRHRHISELCSAPVRVSEGRERERDRDKARERRERREREKERETGRRSAKAINLLLCPVAGRVVKKMQLCRKSKPLRMR